MEALSSQIAGKLQTYNYETLKRLARTLRIKCSARKPEITKAIIQFLLNPCNQKQVCEEIPEEIFADLSEFLPDSSVSCICESKTSGITIICTNCQKKQHRSCMGNLIYMPKYQCLMCQVVQMNPADEVIEFLVLPYLIDSDPLHRKSRNFEVSQALHNDIVIGRNQKEVQIRCLKVESPGFALEWPKQGLLSVNKKPLKELKVGENLGHKRKDTALDISFQLAVGTNEVNLVKLNDPSFYCLSVVIIKRFAEEVLIEKLSKIVMLKETTLESIKSRLLNDDDVESSSMKLTLKCPYTLLLIKKPVRGQNCKHLTCFDLGNFVKMQKYEQFAWKCPICKGLSYALVVDQYFEEIIDSIKELEDIEYVEVFDNGTYKPVFKAAETVSGLKHKENSDPAPSKLLRSEEIIKKIAVQAKEIIEID